VKTENSRTPGKNAKQLEFVIMMMRRRRWRRRIGVRRRWRSNTSRNGDRSRVVLCHSFCVTC
jgi:hypothetical protein